MKLFATTILLMTASLVFSQGIEFEKGNFNKALERAAKEQKLIFVDAYATWCGPCKRMAKYEFTKEDVGKYYNENFINVKMDMESVQGTSFQKKYPVRSYPTLFFIDETGEVVVKSIGAKKGEQLIQLGKSALSKVDYSREFADEYEDGKRDPAFILEYVSSLRKSGKSTLKVANEYLDAHKDKKDETTLRIIKEACVEADSRIFDLLIENRKAIEKIISEEEVEETIREACLATSKKAIDFQVYDLQEMAKETMRKHLPKEADQLAMETDLDYFLSLKDASNYLSCCKEYAKKTIKTEPTGIMIMVDNIYENFHRNEDAMKFAEKYGMKAIKDSENPGDYFLLAKVLYQNGNGKEALKLADKAKSTAQDKKQLNSINTFIKKIQNS